MSIEKELNELKIKLGYSSPAKRIMEHLKPVLNKSSELSKRWGWELLQNASDLEIPVNFKFEFYKSKMIFSHD